MRRETVTGRVTRTVGTAAVAAAVALLAGGCAGYGNYTTSDEPDSTGYLALDSPNSPHMSEVIRRAVVAAVDRSGVDGPYLIRLPESMDTTRRQRVLEALNDADARISDGTNPKGWPEFVVERAIVRVNRAEVDIAVPFAGVSWPDGSEAQQLTTYYLKSGFGRWNVTRMRTWSVGVNERAIVDVDKARRELDAESAQAIVEEEPTKSSDEPPF